MATLTPDLPTGGAEVGDDVGWSVCEGVVNIIKTIGLPGISADSVYHRTVSTIEGLKTPCVVVTGGRDADNFNGGATIGTVDNRYEVFVVIVRASQKGLDGTTPHARQTRLWLSEIKKRFKATRPQLNLPSRCWILSANPVNNDPRFAPAWLKQLDAAFVQLHIVVREDIYRA